MASADVIRYTIESFAGSTNAAKRAAIFAQWRDAQSAMDSGVSSLSIPGLNGSLNQDAIAQRFELLTACLTYLDSVIGEDPGLGAGVPLGHFFDFSAKPMMW